MPDFPEPVPVGIWDAAGNSYYPAATTKLRDRGKAIFAEPSGLWANEYASLELPWPVRVKSFCEASPVDPFGPVWRGVETTRSMKLELRVARHAYVDWFGGNEWLNAQEFTVTPKPVPQSKPVAGPSSRVVNAQSWWIASELARRHPEYLVYEAHPGGGMYDCLVLMRPQPDYDNSIQLNRAGHIHVMSRPEFEPIAWGEVMAAADAPHEIVKRIEDAAGLPSPSPTPPSGPRTLAFRFISAVLNLTLNDKKRWDARNEFCDSSGMGGSYLNGYLDHFPEVEPVLRASPTIGIFQEPQSHFWALLREKTPVALVSIEGVVYRHGASWDLADRYEKHHHRLTSVVTEILGDLLP